MVVWACSERVCAARPPAPHSAQAPIEGITLASFEVGGSVVIHGREFRITGLGDDFTASFLSE